MATPSFLTGEAFPNAYGVASINIPFIVDPNTVASDGSTGAFRPLSTTDLGVVAGANGTDAGPTIDYILDPSIVITGAGAPVTGGFRPKTVTDYNLKTIKARKVVASGANYTGLGTDFLIAWNAPITQRVTGLLPNAATAAVNQVYIVKDEGATATTVNIIIVSGTNCLIDGVGTGAITTARGVIRLYSDGTNYNTW